MYVEEYNDQKEIDRVYRSAYNKGLKKAERKGYIDVSQHRYAREYAIVYVEEWVKAVIECARKMVRDGLNLEKIVLYTGLKLDYILELQLEMESIRKEVKDIRIKAATGMIKNGLDINEIMKYTDLDAERLQKLQEKLG